MVHRSAYQLKEADPHSWALPRLTGPPKAALVEIQADEYGGGRPERIHAHAVRRVDGGARPRSDAYGAYLDAIPGVTLATVNLMSLLGLHRRWRGAIVGHLALFEMTSSIPNRRYANGLRRLGFGEAATDFFDEHVEADAVHENIAAVDLAGGLVRQEPELGADVLWGARALAALDARWAAHVLDAGRPGQLAASADSPAAAELRLRSDGARKRDSLCVPSQSGRMRDLPQRQSAIVSRPTSISRPVHVLQRAPGRARSAVRRGTG